jgi:hypothetical protein
LKSAAGRLAKRIQLTTDGHKVYLSAVDDAFGGEMRMSMRRSTRLTNAFSKKLENHAAMVSLYFTYCNFGRVHQTLRVTPAMQAGIADHVWSVRNR